VVNTVYKNKETLKECFEKLQITRNEATVWAATGLHCMMNDKGLNFGLTFFHCIMPHLYTLYNASSTSTCNEGMNCLTCLPQTQRKFLQPLPNGKTLPQRKRKELHKTLSLENRCAILLSIRWKWSVLSPVSSKVV